MIRAVVLPDVALLCRYRDAGAYTDGYSTDLDFAVSQAEFIEAFYCTWVFRLERWVLAVIVSKPSSDAQARALATGTSDSFAAWTVEGRTANQLLLSDIGDRTRSWLMSHASAQGTRLYFGSAVVPLRDSSARARLGLLFGALLGFHMLYSRVLLRAAVQRLRRRYAA